MRNSSHDSGAARVGAGASRALEKEEERQREEQACEQFHSAPADQPLASLHHGETGDGDEDQGDGEDVGEEGPPAAGVVVEPAHGAEEGTPFEGFVFGLSGGEVGHHVRPALEEHLDGIRLREVVLGVGLLLVDGAEQVLFDPLFGHVAARGEGAFDGEGAAADVVVGVEGRLVVQGDARYGVNQDHAREKEGEIAMDTAADFAHVVHE